MADPISLVAILVPPIISGLVTTFQLIMNARARRKEKKLKLKEQAQAAEQQLVTTLEVGPKRIDEKYELLLHLGKAYQEVDRKTPSISRLNQSGREKRFAVDIAETQ